MPGVPVEEVRMFGLLWSGVFLLLTLVVSAILSLAMMGMPIPLAVEAAAFLSVMMLVLAGGLRLAYVQVHPERR